MWSFKITQVKIILSPLPQSVWPSGLAGWWTTWGTSSHNVIPPISHVVLQDHVKSQGYYILAATISVAGTKLGGMVTYLGCILPMGSSGHAVACFWEIAWQAGGAFISPLPQCLWSQFLAGWCLALGCFCPLGRMAVRSRGLAGSRGGLGQTC